MQPESEISLAAGIMRRVKGQRDLGPAHVQAADAQHAQTGTTGRAPSGTPVQKEAVRPTEGALPCIIGTAAPGSFTPCRSTHDREWPANAV